MLRGLADAVGDVESVVVIRTEGLPLLCTRGASDIDDTVSCAFAAAGATLRPVVGHVGAVGRTLRSPCTTLVEFRVDREPNLALHRRIAEAVQKSSGVRR